MPGAESLRAEVEEDEEEGLGSNRVFTTIVKSITVVEEFMAERLTGSEGPGFLKPSRVALLP